MNCIEFIDLVSDKIDGRLTADQIREFTDHAHVCRHCGSEYLSAATVKAVLKNKVRSVPIPSAVYFAIVHSGADHSLFSDFQPMPR